MGYKLDKPPLIYALAQVVFNPVKGMARFVPNFQDKLRESFPDYVEEMLISQPFPIPLQPGLPPQAMQALQQVPLSIPQWHFMDFQKTSGYVLSERSLVFHSVIYDTFDSFLQNILFGLNNLNEIVTLSFIQRIGLRYINAIYMIDNQDTILHPSLRGMLPTGSKNYIQTFSETINVKDDNIKLLIRAIRNHTGLPLPADLLNIQLPLKIEQIKQNQSAFCLDLDCHFEEREPYSREFINTIFNTLHDYIEKSFNESIDMTFFMQEK
jgi:uncharacterized protein (TIGR04255 family)